MNNSIRRTQYQKLSLDFIISNPSKIAWDKIQYQDNVPEYLLHQHIDEINLKALLEQDYKFSLDFIDTHWLRFKEDKNTLNELIDSIQLPEDKVIELIPLIGGNELLLSGQLINMKIYKIIKDDIDLAIDINDCKLSEELIRHLKDKILLQRVFWNQKLSEQFLLDFYDIKYLNNILQYQKIGNYFLSNHLKDVKHEIKNDF